MHLRCANTYKEFAVHIKHLRLGVLHAAAKYMHPCHMLVFSHMRCKVLTHHRTVAYQGANIMLWYDARSVAGGPASLGAAEPVCSRVGRGRWPAACYPAVIHEEDGAGMPRATCFLEVRLVGCQCKRRWKMCLVLIKKADSWGQKYQLIWSWTSSYYLQGRKGWVLIAFYWYLVQAVLFLQTQACFCCGRVIRQVINNWWKDEGACLNWTKR